MEVPRDLFDARRNVVGGDDLPYLIVWQHAACGVMSETPVSATTFVAIKHYSKVVAGKMPDDIRATSEDEQLLYEFAVELFTIETLADIGWVTGNG